MPEKEPLRSFSPAHPLPQVHNTTVLTVLRKSEKLPGLCRKYGIPPPDPSKQWSDYEVRDPQGQHLQVQEARLAEQKKRKEQEKKLKKAQEKAEKERAGARQDSEGEEEDRESGEEEEGDSPAKGGAGPSRGRRPRARGSKGVPLKGNRRGESSTGVPGGLTATGVKAAGGAKQEVKEEEGEEEEFDVEKIVDFRVTTVPKGTRKTKGGGEGVEYADVIEFRVRWATFGEEDDTWEPEENLV